MASAPVSSFSEKIRDVVILHLQSYKPRPLHNNENHTPGGLLERPLPAVLSAMSLRNAQVVTSVILRAKHASAVSRLLVKPHRPAAKRINPANCRLFSSDEVSKARMAAEETKKATVKDTIFSKILSKEIPADIVHEDAKVSCVFSAY